MTLYTSETTLGLWQEAIKQAEDRCSIALQQELEAYLVSLLTRYTNKPEVVKQVFATAYLKAMQLHERGRYVSLQDVGDQCLLFSGLFPHSADKRHVKLTYYVDLGRTAYATISQQADDLFGALALQFVVLTDVLQSIPAKSDLLPLEAYEQWSELGSQRALKMLKEYADNNVIPLRHLKK